MGLLGEAGQQVIPWRIVLWLQNREYRKIILLFLWRRLEASRGPM